MIIPHSRINEEISLLTLSNMLETMSESVIITGPNTRILLANSAAEIIFSRNFETLKDRRLSEVIRDPDVHEAYRKALESDISSEIRLETAGKDLRKFNVRVAPIEINGSRSAVGVFYDVTKIERLENIRQEFLSNISHELRTPLTSILAFVETLEDGAIEDKENNSRFLRVIRKNAERMHHLIDDILELSSIESGTIRIDPQLIALGPQVDEAFTNLSSKAADRRISLVSEIDKEVRVFADVMRLGQMLTNLIDNAIKFNREGGTVVVRHTSSAAKNIISITDSGNGIPPEHQVRIFERFYRTDRARSNEIGGTGLGLAIVKHLARLHGGEVNVASAVGKGTTFSIELPAKHL
ncbi:MAG: PAS domain-containing protein [Pyrinomonadaceae bacterium]|nr:PAS domain-containing protein [Pyrinomonadaceae bacterium]